MMESSIARESDDIVYTHAGPEIGVASTKAFMTQMLALNLVALFLGRRRGTASAEVATEAEPAVPLARIAEQILTDTTAVETISRTATPAIFSISASGRELPHRLGGALKLKEISYIHAEAHAAGEMKHDPSRSSMRICRWWSSVPRAVTTTRPPAICRKSWPARVGSSA